MSSTPAPQHEATAEQRRAAENSVWDTARRAALMLANALIDAGVICRSRNMAILGAALMALAGAIDKRMR